MTFRATDFLTGLFRTDPADSPQAPSAQPQATAAPADSPAGSEPLQPQGRSPGDVPAAAGPAPQAGPAVEGWVARAARPGPRVWESPDLPDEDRWWAVADFEALPLPDWTCPQCGRFGWWEDLTGGRHCLTCEHNGHMRATRLAERAGRLRQRAADVAAD